MLKPILLMGILICSVTVPYAFADMTADRNWEFWEQWKLFQIEKAKKTQKQYYHYDYDDIQNKDKGFKTFENIDKVKKKIKYQQVPTFKIIKNLNN